MATYDFVHDAFARLGIEAREPTRNDAAVDIVLDPAGLEIEVQLKHRSLVDEAVARRLLADVGTHPEMSLLVVGDRVTSTARNVLTAAGAGYLDLRGHVALRSGGLVIDTDVPPLVEHGRRTDALSGAAGLEVAATLLMEPQRGFAVRALARDLGRSPSTVSSILQALRNDGLTDERNLVAGPDLFWQLAERWPTPRTALVAAPQPRDPMQSTPLRLNVDDLASPGWALTDSAAASSYGAPLAVRTGQTLDFFVPDQATLRRAVTLIGEAPTRDRARATVRVAPVQAAVHRRLVQETADVGWPLTPLLFVALDLAQDVGRGREILESWTPEEEWRRVW